MQSVLLIIYLIFYFTIISITWHEIGVEKTRNSAMKLDCLIGQIASYILKESSKEISKKSINNEVVKELEEDEREKMKLYYRLAKTSKILTLMGLIFVGYICYYSVINLRYEWYVNFVFILLIMYVLEIAINAYVKGCEKAQKLLKPKVVEWEHEEKIFYLKKIGKVLKTVTFICALVYLIVLLMI